MEGLDSIARRYGIRPSALLGERNPFVALSIDLWAHNWGVQGDLSRAQLAEIKAGARGRRK